MDTPPVGNKTTFVIPPPPLTPAERRASLKKTIKSWLWIAAGTAVVGLVIAFLVSSHIFQENQRLAAERRLKWIADDRALWLEHWELVKAGKRQMASKFRNRDELSSINQLDAFSFGHQARYYDVVYDFTGTLPVGFEFGDGKIVEPLPNGSANTWENLQAFAEALKARKMP
jgi:hypothetical protein